MNNKRTSSTDLLGYWLRKFLVDHVIVTRNLSRNTQISYRDTFRLLVTYAADSTHKAIDKLKVDDISKDVVTAFLDHIESSRKSSVTSRNQRLAAIKSFAKFLAWKSPEHIDWCHQIRMIPSKKTSKRMITYMDKKEIDALTAAPLKDKNSVLAKRDHAILLLMYNTGARVSEIAKIQVKDIAMPKRKGMGMVTLHGKGRRERTCPLWEEFWDLLKPFMEGKCPEDFLFLNRYNKPMSRYCIYELVRKYSKAISAQCPSLSKKRPSPHTIRHTTATHLLESGTDIDTVRSWLGHSSIDTTNIYAEISMKKKMEILQKYEIPNADSPNTKWAEDKELMTFLDSL